MNSSILQKAKHFACEFLWIDAQAVEVVKLNLPEGYFGNAYESCEDEYCVEISDTLNLKDQLITLFHELTHVRQFMLGHLNYDDSKLSWEGEQYGCEEPWEYEAYKYEKIIYELFLSSLNSMDSVPVQFSSASGVSSYRLV